MRDSCFGVASGIAGVTTSASGISPSQKKAVALLKKNADLTMALVDDMFDFLEEDKKSSQGFTIDKEGNSDQKMVASTIAPLETPYALLVEDSEPNILITGTFLKELGYNYDIAKNGPEALKKFSAGHYSIIIMDVQMPGMDGLEATRQIRAIEKKKDLKPTPILATTGNATEDDQLFCVKAGMNDYLSKPFELEDLAKKLKKLILAKQYIK